MQKKAQIRFAEAYKVAALEETIDEILEVLGVEALVTDESILADFATDPKGTPERDQWLQDLGAVFGFEVKGSDYLWDIAARIKGRHNMCLPKEPLPLTEEEQTWAEGVIERLSKDKEQ